MRKMNAALLALGLGSILTCAPVCAAESMAEPAVPGVESAAEAAISVAEEAAEASGEGIFPAIAGENGTTYENFFEVTLSEDNYDIWKNCVAAVMGESAADDTVAYMQATISSDMYGEEAINYFSENPDQPSAFDCWYINGAKLFTFNPDFTVTVDLEDGSSETHSYEYLGVYSVGAGETMSYMGNEISVEFPCDVYKSTDEAGEFNYLFLRDDTMEETGHIEFRYGKDLEELQGYFVGPYAYWLSAGFDVNADEETLKSTIELFCLENMDCTSHSEEALSQISDFIGSWRADLSELGEEYADTELIFTIDENGHGSTVMDGAQTADFEAFAYDSGKSGDGVGTYVAYSNLEMEAEAAPYIMEERDGETVLTFYAADGEISYVRENAEGSESDTVEISTAEELAAISDNLSGNYVLTADIDLGGAEWTPIGSFIQMGQEGEEAETPDSAYAFTGIFDGNGYTISNFTINQPEGWCVGLFGCIANANVGNFRVENASTLGTTMVSDVVGYSYCSTIYDVELEGGTVDGAGENAEGIGDIVGAGFFNEETAAAYGAPYDEPTVFDIINSKAA